MIGKVARFRAAILGVLAGLMLALAPAQVAVAQDRPIRLAGVMSEERIGPVFDALSLRLPGVDLTYERLSSAQIVAGARRPKPSFDIALLASPDIAVSIANEGYAARDDAAGSGTQWRQEVFGLWADPAVMLLRRDAFPGPMPRTRIELVRALEQNSARFSRRVGIVNIGIDDVSYFLASQDSIRTSLYWRLMRAFGAASARIYDTTDDLLSALRDGEVDVLYNVPLSAWQAGQPMPAGVEVVVPQDYVLAVPWTLLVPEGTSHPRSARAVLDALRSDALKPALATAGLAYPADFTPLDSLQRIELGPELLVFRDIIKRSKFLDIWFQAVVN